MLQLTGELQLIIRDVSVKELGMSGLEEGKVHSTFYTILQGHVSQFIR